MADLSKYEIIINHALERRESVVFGCNCTIRYSGRAESYLAAGDRIVVIKQDGTLLVHQPEGSTPANYMKNGSSHTVNFRDAKIYFKSQNLDLKEFMDIEIFNIYFYHSQRLDDDQMLEIAGTEEDMAKMLFNEPSLIEEGFRPLSTEEHTKYGFIDLFGYDKDSVLTVVECKRYNGDLSAVTQLRRYVEKIKDAKGLERVRGILACPKISSHALKMLQDWGFEFRMINPPNYLERYDKGQRKLEGF